MAVLPVPLVLVVNGSPESAATADDMLVALAHLADRAGARQLEIGYDDVTQPVTWWVSVYYQGTRFMVQGHPTPSSAALRMAEKLLAKAEAMNRADRRRAERQGRGRG